MSAIDICLSAANAIQNFDWKIEKTSALGAKDPAPLLVYVFSKIDAKTKKSQVEPLLLPHQLKALAEFTGGVKGFSTPDGVVLLVMPQSQSREFSEDLNPAKVSEYSEFRDIMSQVHSLMVDKKAESCEIHFVNTSLEQTMGAVVGLELCKYKFKSTLKKAGGSRKISICHHRLRLKDADLKSHLALAAGTNLARHLVSLPPNWLHTDGFEQVARSLFEKKSDCKIEVWNKSRLKKEGMELHLAVGMASEYEPKMIHIRYRPKGSSKKKPVAFVGKGITFDSGGLDIKPAAGMRLMKKDMGGAAALMGLAHWAVQSKLKQPCDFFIGLAENSISDEAFRPSDILTSRNGLTVEVHNTDAEGRLVLADVMDVAATKKEKWKCLIDVATLTGAIKVGLGSGVGGLFSNDRDLAAKIQTSAEAKGDPLWTMPLIQSYRSSLNSPFADMVNCTDGYGGAITAALFLEPFAKKHKWAHLDIYAWNDGPKGALRESGGSGQAVQALADFLSK